MGRVSRRFSKEELKRAEPRGKREPERRERARIVWLGDVVY